MFLVVKENKKWLLETPVYANGKFDQAGLAEFLEKYNKGEIEQHIKS